MEDDIALLAWIDFCKQEKVEPSEGILNFMVLFHGVPSRDAVKEHLRVLWKRYNDQSDDSDQAMKLVGMLSKGSAYMTKLPGGMHEGIRILVDQHTSNATSLLITKVMKDIQTQKTATGQSKAHPLEEEGKRGVKRGKQVEKADQSPPPSKKARSSTVCISPCHEHRMLLSLLRRLNHLRKPLKKSPRIEWRNLDHLSENRRPLQLRLKMVLLGPMARRPSEPSLTRSRPT